MSNYVKQCHTSDIYQIYLLPHSNNIVYDIARWVILEFLQSTDSFLKERGFSRYS